MKKIVVQQGCIPDYRLGFFNAVSHELNYAVYAGDAYFDSSIKTVATLGPWYLPVKNRYLGGRRLLWQGGAIFPLLNASVAVMELNPRILSNWIALVLRKILKRPSILWGHYGGNRMSGNPTFGGIRKVMASLADGIAAYTDHDATSFRKWQSDKKIGSLGNSCICRTQIDISGAYNGKGDIIYVGRLVPEKKVDILISSFLKWAQESAKKGDLHIVGEGKEMDRLKALSNASKMSARVKFYGHLSQGELLTSLYRCSTFATSPGYAGLSVIQAMAHGVPVIVSEGEPHSPEIEACLPNKTAIFVTSASIDHWVKVLKNVEADSQYWITRRPKIAKFACETYTFESMAANFIQLVKQF